MHVILSCHVFKTVLLLYMLFHILFEEIGVLIVRFPTGWTCQQDDGDPLLKFWNLQGHGEKPDPIWKDGHSSTTHPPPENMVFCSPL